MINKAILVGNLGKDPEIRNTQSGTTIAKLTVATTERVKKGEAWEDHTEWHRVVCFGRLAENAGRYLRKGRQVYVEGRIRTEKWKDQSGQDRYTTEIVAEDIKFLGGGGQRDAEPSRAASGASDIPADPGASGGWSGGGDEDVPF